MNDLETPVQPENIQNLDLDDTLIVNKDRIGEDYHSCFRLLASCLKDSSKFWRQFQTVMLSKFH